MFRCCSLLGSSVGLNHVCPWVAFLTANHFYLPAYANRSYHSTSFMPWQRDGFKFAFFQFRAKFEHVAGEL